MSYRIQGITNAFEKDSGANSDRTIGQLVRITEAGKATNVAGQENKLFFPLTQNLDVSDDLVAEAQVTGIAKVYVEAYAGIVAGSAVSPGATGVGIAAYTEGVAIIGIALATPTVNGQLIPVLLAPAANAAALY